MTSLFENFTDDDYFYIGIPKILRDPSAYQCKDLKKAGLVYQGTKREIARDILQAICEDLKIENPSQWQFYDLFGGSGSMSLNAFENGFNTHYNELEKPIFAFVSYLFNRIKNGKFGTYGILDDRFYSFYSRDEAKNAFNSDDDVLKGFLLFMFNFGCKGRFSYFCNKEKEIQKMHGHNLVMFCDEKGAKFYADYFKKSTHWIIYEMLDEFRKYKPNEWQQKRLIFTKLILKIEAIRVAELQDDFKNFHFDDLIKFKRADLVNLINEKRPNIEKKKNYKANDLKQLQQLEQLQRLQRLEQLEQLEQLQRLEHLDNLITTSNLSYENVKITGDLSKIIIYCDPPYIGTTEYNKKNRFNHEHFYEYLRNLAKKGAKIYMSEYAAPADFIEIWDKDKFVKLSSATNQIIKIERLFKL